MQGLFFRVDGADLETGEETYLVLQAPSSGHAEQIARRQGLLIASVRPATTADWGVSTSAAPVPAVTETIVFEGVSSAAIEIVEPAAELASPVSSEPNPTVESSGASVIFEEVESPSVSAETQDNLKSEPGELAGTFDALPAAMDVATWMASRPPIDARETIEDQTATVPVTAATDQRMSTVEPILDESVAARDTHTPSNFETHGETATSNSPAAKPPQSEIEIHDAAISSPTSAVWPAAANSEIETKTSPPSTPEAPTSATVMELSDEIGASDTPPVAVMPSPPLSISDVHEGASVVAQPPPPGLDAGEPTATSAARESLASMPKSKLPGENDRENAPPTPARNATANATAAGPGTVRPKPRIVAPASKSQPAVGAMATAAPGSVPKPPAPKPLPAAAVFAPRIPTPKTQPAPGIRRAPATVVPGNAPAASSPAITSRIAGTKSPAKPSPGTTGRPAPRPAASSAAASTRPAGSPTPTVSKTVLPPRPLPPVVPPPRPTRLTPPTVKRIPPVMPPVSAVVAEPPAPPAPSQFSSLEVEAAPPTIETAASAQAIETAPGMLDTVESLPTMETFHDMAPVAAESQRVSGDVVGGSQIEQVVTKIAWDQTAHAVEHSSGSALERLASAATASYPPDPRFDDPFSAIPAAELAVTSAAPADAFSTDQSPVSVVEEVATAPAVAVADSYPPASHTAAASFERRAAAGSNSMLPVFYILGPLAILVSAAGIGLVVWSMFMRVAPADLEDLAKLDFRVTTLTQILLGGMAFLGGLLLFVCAALAYVAGAIRAQNRN